MHAVIGSSCLPATLVLVGLYRIVCLVYKLATGHLTLLDSCPWTKDKWSFEIDKSSSPLLMIHFLLIVFGDFAMAGIGIAWLHMNRKPTRDIQESYEEESDEEDFFSSDDPTEE
eukprot:gnl/MRDRNA2_/MRDRNA2_21343_c0_seq1.p1 gnl/MRDRNA2_/MRDRNA2_21343_c0~~gnl/MRDRNA2_/MRDRNA2_21343_c0_seq1.p1  ORF type:complete len:131 (-),score=15.85 gnl/MRDRNA2_/MRDRNA2_21343_c0_seq1:2-343(-)